MLPKFPQERGTTRLDMNCEACCFFRLVELESRKLRLLCMLTGEKRPIAGMAGCNFIPGQWSQIDRILGLPKSRLSGNTGDPNHTELGDCFSRNGRKSAKKEIHSLDDSIGFPINHTAKAERGSLARLGYRKAQVARMARERV